MSDLKPCPFCGSAVRIKREPENMLCFIVCDEGSLCQGADLHVGFTPEKEASAIEAWNRRAQSSTQSTVEVGTTVQAGQVLSDVVRDAERYRKLRTFHWSEHSMCVVLDPKKSVLLGAVCPSGANLDDYLDAAIAQQKGGV